MVILAGDIGGTKTNLAIFLPDGSFSNFHSFPSHDYPDLGTVVLDYLKMIPSEKIEGASFAIAGPVYKGVCKATNLPWIVDTAVLSKQLKIESIFLLNDLEANAYGVGALKDSDFFTLQEGKDQEGNCAVISPGTGLGEAVICRGVPFASEGGHSDFAPTNPLQVELYHYLASKFDHVSFERILSGPGLFNLFCFLRDVKKEQAPNYIQEPSDISKHHTLPICDEALTLFAIILGQEAANLALKVMARGGVYIGGGIPPKILPKLKERHFLDGFLNKGRFKDLLEEIPIKVILDDKAGLKGAARFLYFSDLSGKS